MKRVVAAGLLAMAALGTLPSVQGSGSYIGGPPRAPSRIDATRYELGKAVFGGKTIVAAEAASGPAAASQADCLKQWQNRIPRSAQNSVDLPRLAGRITDDQFKALAYFLEIRFNVKCDSLPRP